MSFALVLTLALQAIAVVVVFAAVRRRRSGYLGVLLVIVLVVYHGLGEVLQRLFPDLATYRTLIGQNYVDRFLPYIGLAILAYGISYAVEIRRRPIRRSETDDWWPSWKLVFVTSLPMWVVAAGVATLTGVGIHYWASGIASQFLVLASGLTTSLYISQSEHPHQVLALLLQSLALALLGERSGVVAAALMVLWAIALLGRPYRKRSIFAILGVILMFAIVISAARATAGRPSLTTGAATNRLSGLSSGVSSLMNGHLSGIGKDYIYRIDGNAWPSFVLQRQQYTPLASPVALKNDLLLTIPHVLYRTKLSTPITQRAEEYYFDVHYNIPTTGGITPLRGVDWLPTLFGSALAYGGPLGMVLFGAFMGWALARTDRRLHERASFASLLVGLGFVMALTAGYEGGFDGVALIARGVLIVWLAVKAVVAIRRAVTRNPGGAALNLAQPAYPQRGGAPSKEFSP